MPDVVRWLIWGGVGVVSLVYIGLFLARKQVSLRPLPFFVLLALGVAGEWIFARSLLADLLGLGFLVAVGAGLLSGTSPRLVHASADEVRREIDEACRRLFIQKEEAPSRLRLTAKGKTSSLALVPLGFGFVLILLPRAREPGKLTLFFDWLAKRYPNPVPKIRVDLTRR